MIEGLRAGKGNNGGLVRSFRASDLYQASVQDAATCLRKIKTKGEEAEAEAKLKKRENQAGEAQPSEGKGMKRGIAC
jgi:hypothetical protein